MCFSVSGKSGLFGIATGTIKCLTQAKKNPKAAIKGFETKRYHQWGVLKYSTLGRSGPVAVKLLAKCTRYDKNVARASRPPPLRARAYFKHEETRELHANRPIELNLCVARLLTINTIGSIS